MIGAAVLHSIEKQVVVRERRDRSGGVLVFDCDRGKLAAPAEYQAAAKVVADGCDAAVPYTADCEGEPAHLLPTQLAPRLARIRARIEHPFAIENVRRKGLNGEAR